MSEIRANKLRIAAIDSFRGIAALSVIIFHIFNHLGYNFFNYGLTGVDLFFMISGFVIFLTLDKTDNWKSFVAGRVARLYPVYWACVTITAILIFSQTGLAFDLPKVYLFNLTMFQNYFKVGHLDFPYWTLVVEMQFYMLMLLLFISSLLKKIEWVAGIISLLTLVYATFIYANYPHAFHVLNNGVPILNHFPLFFAGILFFKMKLGRGSLPLQIVLLVACYIISCRLFVVDDRIGFLTATQYCITLALWFLLFTVYIVQEKLLKILKPLVFIGTVSYSLYLIHQYFSFFILIPFLERYINNNVLIAIVTINVDILVAVLLTFAVEKRALLPMKNLMLRILGYRKQQDRTIEQPQPV